ncbi:MAG: hypothetical protein ACI9SY_000420 [Candidatus Paceibacteria bacterium]|jgi:hypothetical protein
MKRFGLSLLTVFAASPALASSHNGVPADTSWLQLAYIELECLVTTTWLVIQLIMSGNWVVLANLEGLCMTAVNSAFFSNPYVAVMTALVLVLATLVALRSIWQALTARISTSKQHVLAT